MRPLRGLPAFLLAAIALGASAAAAGDDPLAERILLFRSEISVKPDASLEVRETIRGRAAGVEIRHGIYRDFPTRYRVSDGSQRTVPFTVASVERDGRPEPWHTAGRENGVRVYLGDKDRLVEPGEHTWVITYRTARQLGFFAEHDELYWNVTGNGWIFPIDEAEARVTLPADPRGDVRLEAYTGPFGSKERAYAASWEPASRSASIRATRGLAPYEGLTVVVMWPKGVVAEPTRSDRLRWMLDDSRATIAGALGFLAVLVYYLVAWFRVGRDPERGVIVTLFAPPQGLSPAAVRYLKRMAFDAKVFAAAVVQMAVKGHLVIENVGGTYTLRRTLPGRMPLDPVEKKIAERLFNDVESVTLEQTQHLRIGDSLSLLREHLKRSSDRVHFLLNRGHFIVGVVISVGVLAATLLLSPGESGGAGGFLTVWLLGWSVGVGALGARVAGAWRMVLSGAGRRQLALPGAVFLTLFSIPFLFGEIVGIRALFAVGGVHLGILLLCLIGVNLFFDRLLKAPTPAGRALLDRIEGFERFLSATEEDRINRLQGPRRTPELYERLLPFAIALDLEQRWSEQFAEELAAAGSEGRTAGTYTPTWYHGDFGGQGWSPAAFSGSVGSALGGAISSSSTAPGSRSGGGGGGGGGGSSGGGGGGGGGGGW